LTIPFDMGAVLLLGWSAKLRERAMRMLRSADVSWMMPDSVRGHTILAVLLWGGVTIFIFGILADVIR
jgi:hypothetical protein